MPRTVQLAVVVLGTFGLLGLAAAAHYVLEAVVRSGLPSIGQGYWIVWVTYGAVSALMTARGLVRRRAQARAVALWSGLALACVFGILGTTFAVILLANAGVPSVTLVEPAMNFVAAGLSAAIAWSLSRHSAKAWFASPPEGGHVGRA